MHDVEGAKHVYGLLKKRDAKLSDELVQKLFEFISFYNLEQVQPDEFTESRHFDREMNNMAFIERGPDREKKPKNLFADELYHSIENKTAATFNTRIRGLTKEERCIEAIAIYDKMIDDKLPIDVETYNTIIDAHGQTQSSNDNRWRKALDVLEQMNEAKIKPDVHTLNIMLDNISIGGLYAVLRERALSTLAEFKNIGVEPSLGTWYLILKIFCREQTPTSHILIDILNEIEGKELKYESKYDLSFFQKAMLTCSSHIKDINTAKRLDKLLNTNDNYNFIGDSTYENLYYRNYLNVLLQGPFDDFLKAFHEFVPNLYSMDIQMFTRILQKIKENQQIQHIPIMFSNALITNLVSFRYARTLELLIAMMAEKQPNITIAAQADLSKQFGEIAWELWTENRFHLDKQEELEDKSNQHIQWIYSAEAIGDIVCLLCRAGEFSKAKEIMELFLTNYKEHTITGAISYSKLVYFVEQCVDANEKELAIQTVEYAVDKAYKGSVNLGKLIIESMKLNERDSRKLKNLLGANILNSPKKNRSD